MRTGHFSVNYFITLHSHITLHSLPFIAKRSLLIRLGVAFAYEYKYLERGLAPEQFACVNSKLPLEPKTSSTIAFKVDLQYQNISCRGLSNPSRDQLVTPEQPWHCCTGRHISPGRLVLRIVRFMAW